jgi:translation initiation factor IF-1
MKQGNIESEGEVLKELGNSMFLVQLNLDGSPEIICTISGKIRKNYIRIMAGDKVKVEMSPYDLTKGRITTRLRLQGTNNNNNNSTNYKKK